MCIFTTSWQDFTFELRDFWFVLDFLSKISNGLNKCKFVKCKMSQMFTVTRDVCAGRSTNINALKNILHQFTSPSMSHICSREAEIQADLVHQAWTCQHMCAPWTSTEPVIYLCVTVCVLITETHTCRHTQRVNDRWSVHIQCVCESVAWVHVFLHWCLKSGGPAHPGSPLKVCSCTQTDTHMHWPAVSLFQCSLMSLLFPV